MIKDGSDDSPEGEAVRDSLDIPLRALSQAEYERVQWLSEDLFSISEPTAGAGSKAIGPREREWIDESSRARRARDWDNALALLRKLIDYLPPSRLSYLRGSVWLEAGFPEIASEFYGHASTGEPADANALALYMYSLAESQPEAAGRLAREVLADDAKHAPLAVA